MIANASNFSGAQQQQTGQLIPQQAHEQQEDVLIGNNQPVNQDQQDHEQRNMEKLKGQNREQQNQEVQLHQCQDEHQWQSQDEEQRQSQDGHQMQNMGNREQQSREGLQHQGQHTQSQPKQQRQSQGQVGQQQKIQEQQHLQDQEKQAAQNLQMSSGLDPQSTQENDSMPSILFFEANIGELDLQSQPNQQQQSQGQIGHQQKIQEQQHIQDQEKQAAQNLQMPSASDPQSTQENDSMPSVLFFEANIGELDLVSSQDATHDPRRGNPETGQTKHSNDIVNQSSMFASKF